MFQFQPRPPSISNRIWPQAIKGQGNRISKPDTNEGERSEPTDARAYLRHHCLISAGLASMRAFCGHYLIPCLPLRAVSVPVCGLSLAISCTCRALLCPVFPWLLAGERSGSELSGIRYCPRATHRNQTSGPEILFCLIFILFMQYYLPCKPELISSCILFIFLIISVLVWQVLHENKYEKMCIIWSKD